MNTEKILKDALIHHGYSPAGADGLIELHNSAVLKDSDHSAYRELADEIFLVMIGQDLEEFMADGDHSELEIVKGSVAWLPDLVRHAEAQRLRLEADRLWAHTGPFAEGIRTQIHAVLNALDPFDRNGRGWRRKTTGEPVPVAWNEEEK